MKKAISSTPLGRAIVVGLSLLVVLVGLAVANPRGEFWQGVEFPKAQCEAYDSSALGAHSELSEAVYSPAKLARLIREPQNTVSNLAFVVVGVAILLAARRSGSRSLGLACVFLGFGSGVYHASLLAEWRMIDILGVYAVLFSLLFLGASALFRELRESVAAWIGVICAWSTAVYTGVYRNDIRVWGFKAFDSTYVMIAAVGVGCILALVAAWRAIDRRAYTRAATVLAISAPVALVGGLGDRFGGFLANPDALVQGHSVWHVFGGVGILAFYEVFASTGFDRSTLCSAGDRPA